jgi:hypothetical protein
MTRLEMIDAETAMADLVNRGRARIHARLVEIQAELDLIGPTFGMQWRRNELTREKNELLDQLGYLRGV